MPAPTSSTRRSTPPPTGWRSTPSRSRASSIDEDETRRAAGIAQALHGEVRLPDVIKRAAPKGRIKAFAVEPEVQLNNQWSNRFTVIEVIGLDRPGLLHELTSTISRLGLNIASAHVATFGERVVDVFYVTDLIGAKIDQPSRQAAIKRALTQLLGPAPELPRAVRAAG